MTDTALADARPDPANLDDRGLTETASERVSYLRAGHTLRSWLLTTDHKRIAILYLISVTLFFFIGGAAAALMRIELLTPQGDLLTSDGYNRAFTLHGVIMVWFFLIPSIPNTFGNFLIPLMIGARDLAFPRLNLLSWYIYILGGLFTVYVLISGGVDTGWTFYTPLSSMFANGKVVLAATAIFVVGFSSILTGLNFIVTIHKLRCPGMSWGRLPLFVWSHYATSIILVLATPVLSITLVLIAAERLFGLGIFDPKLGGDPLLYQHLFWFYSHPAVYIMVLPALGVVSELVAAAARKPVFGYKFVAGSSIAIAVIGFLVWGHHMFVSGQSMYASAVFSFLSLVVAVPSGIKIYNWTATLYKGHISLDPPFLFAMGFIGLFVVGGLTGLILAMLAMDVHVHRHLFRRGAFPLHHGRRHGLGLSRRAALLVAQDRRAALSGDMGAALGDLHFPGLQPHLFPAIHPGLSGHAPALPRLPAGVPGAACDVVGGRQRARRRLSVPLLLSVLVDALRGAGRTQSMGRDRPGMDGRLAAAEA